MKRFRFRLDRVLQLRAAAERDQARRLADARHEETTRQAAAEELARKLAEASEQVGGAQREPRTAGTIGNLMLAVEAARARWTAAKAAHQESQARLEAELASYSKSRQDRRALEKLREHRHQAWERDVERAEQQHMDEVTLRAPRGRQVGE